MRNQDGEGDDDNEEDGSDVEGDGQLRNAQADQPNEMGAPLAPTLAYREFLQFLELGCSGSPLQGYPTVIIILSTIPPSVSGA